MSETKRVLSESIGSVESRGTGSYRAKNPKSSAVGKHQIMFSQWKDKIRQFSGNPNLTEEDFINDPELQEKFMQYFEQTVLNPDANKLKKRHATRLKARKLTDDDDIKTLLHYQGYPGAVHYLKTGESKWPEGNAPIEEYLEKARKERKMLKDKSKVGDNEPKAFELKGS